MVIKRIKSLFAPKRAPVTYDSSFFQQNWFENWENLKGVLRELIEADPGWKRILDFGCGPGIMIDYMNDAGYDYIGCDYMEEPRRLYLDNYGKYPDKYIASLEECEGRDFDLVISFDVFEHLTDNEISELLRKLDHIPELLVNVSRAKHIDGHINIKKDRQWIRFISAHGYRFDREKTEMVRSRYARIRPERPDEWDKNIFIFSSIRSGS